EIGSRSLLYELLLVLLYWCFGIVVNGGNLLGIEKSCEPGSASEAVQIRGTSRIGQGIGRDFTIGTRKEDQFARFCNSHPFRINVIVTTGAMATKELGTLNLGIAAYQR